MQKFIGNLHFVNKFLLFCVRQSSVKKFPPEPNVGNLKAFSVKIFKNTRFARESKFKPIGIQKLLFVAERLVHGVFSVFAVAEQGMADTCKVRPYLMSSAREQLNLNKAQPVFFGNDLLFCFDLLCSPAFICKNLNLVFAFVL